MVRPNIAPAFAFKTNLYYLLQRNLIYADARLDFVSHQSTLQAGISISMCLLYVYTRDKNNINILLKKEKGWMETWCGGVTFLSRRWLTKIRNRQRSIMEREKLWPYFMRVWAYKWTKPSIVNKDTYWAGWCGMLAVRRQGLS